MMSTKEYVVLDKQLLETCLKDLGNALHKAVKAPNVHCELIVVGGASIVLNYGFRFTTSDIDCTDEQRILMNDVVNKVAEKHNIPPSWINTDFMNTNSYSPKLSIYSSYYKSYGNGTLIIRTIKDEYLLAMKVMSGRKYKNDYSDIYGIIDYCAHNNHPISVELLEKAIIELYGSLKNVDKSAFEFAKKLIVNPLSIPYLEITQMESANATILRTKVKKDANKADIEYILSKLNIN